MMLVRYNYAIVLFHVILDSCATNCRSSCISEAALYNLKHRETLREWHDWSKGIPRKTNRYASAIQSSAAE